MTVEAGAILGPWSSFFVIVGSAAAALTGLTFVVVTLISDGSDVGRNPDGIRAFSTPTVVHFGAVLFLSAMISAPWRSLLGPELFLAATGIGGVVYVARLIHHTRNFTEYTPDLEDWAWYSALPLFAYAILAGAAIMLVGVPGNALFAVGFGALLLIFVGIHNSWDIVTYITVRRVAEEAEHD
jgi:hypothetical protein